MLFGIVGSQGLLTPNPDLGFVQRDAGLHSQGQYLGIDKVLLHHLQSSPEMRETGESRNALVPYGSVCAFFPTTS